MARTWWVRQKRGPVPLPPRHQEKHGCRKGTQESRVTLAEPLVRSTPNLLTTYKGKGPMLGTGMELKTCARNFSTQALAGEWHPNPGCGMFPKFAHKE